MCICTDKHFGKKKGFCSGHFWRENPSYSLYGIKVKNSKILSKKSKSLAEVGRQTVNGL